MENSVKILLGDDDLETHKLVVDILEPYNVVVVGAYTESQIYNKLVSNEFDYAFIDIRIHTLENVDGLCLVELSKDYKLKTQIYFITSYDLGAINYDRVKDLVKGIITKDSLVLRFSEIFKSYLK